MRFAMLLSLCLFCVSAARAQDEPGFVHVLDPHAELGYPGPTIPLDVSGVREDPLLGPGRRPAIVPVADADGRVHAARDPVFVVHGIRADFGDVAPLIRRLGEDQDRYQAHVVAYADTKRRTSKNGDDLARLLVDGFAGRPLAFVAHSMGGIVVRRALNRLALTGELALFPSVRVLAVDTPWHGYDGPADGLRMRFARPFMPDGYEDMRARAPMFAGDERQTDPLDRGGLYAFDLPASVQVHVVVAERGDAALDYTELPDVAAQLARRLDLEPFSPGTPVQVRNFVSALAQSEVGRAIEREGVPLTPACVLAALELHAPRLPGDHSTVLASEAFHARLGSFLGVELERP